MLTKIICSKGFMYWVDLSASLIEEVTCKVKEESLYKLILRHPALAVEGGEIDWVNLTDYMSKDVLHKKYGCMLPVDVTLDFNG